MAFVVSLIIGLSVTQRVINEHVSEQVPGSTPDAVIYLQYKAQVQAYVWNHPGFNGTVDSSALAVGGTQAALIGAGNDVRSTAAGTTVTTWATGTSSLLAAIILKSGGDVAIGTSAGTTWSTPSLGDMGALPLTVASGDIVSSISFSGTGFNQ